MVRKAEIRDIDALLRLLVQVDLVHHNGRPDLFKGPATKYSAAELAALLTRADAEIFVYEAADGAILGHAFCFLQETENTGLMQPHRTLYIDDICVEETARRQGVGKALYDRALACAKAHGCYNVTLNVWTCNPGAAAFYERLGMRPYKVGMETILGAQTDG